MATSRIVGAVLLLVVGLAVAADEAKEAERVPFRIPQDKEPTCPKGWVHKSHNDQCYKLSTTKLTYSDAQKDCRLDGGTLVSLKTDEEYEFVKSLLSGAADLYASWIGLTYSRDWWTDWPAWRWPDGYTVYSPRWLPGEPTKVSESACVAWRTLNNTVSEDGYKVLNCKYAQPFVCKQHAAGCPSHVYTRNEDNLTSSNYPNNYDNNLNCYYHIKVKEGYRIRLEFHEFYTEPYYDKLTIYDDYDANDTAKIDTLSGYTLSKRVYESTENTLTLRFETDHIVTKTGWKASYKALPKDKEVIITNPEGVLTSPLYPNNYPNDQDEVYIIKALPDQYVQLKIVDFLTEFRYDFLTIQDGDDLIHSKEIVRLTGTNVTVPQTFHTRTNAATLRFFSDPSIPKKGFKLEYKALNRN